MKWKPTLEELSLFMLSELTEVNANMEMKETVFT